MVTCLHQCRGTRLTGTSTILSHIHIFTRKDANANGNSIVRSHSIRTYAPHRRRLLFSAIIPILPMISKSCASKASPNMQQGKITSRMLCIHSAAMTRPTQRQTPISMTKLHSFHFRCASILCATTSNAQPVATWLPLAPPARLSHPLPLVSAQTLTPDAADAPCQP